MDPLLIYDEGFLSMFKTTNIHFIWCLNKFVGHGELIIATISSTNLKLPQRHDNILFLGDWSIKIIDLDL